MSAIGDLLLLVGQFKGVVDERKARELEEFLKKQQAEQDRLDSEARRKLAEIQGKAAMEDIETSRSKRAQDTEDALMKRLRSAAGIEGVTPESVIRQTEATGQGMRFGLPGATPSRAAEVNLGGRMGAMRQGISSVLTPQQRQVQGEAGRLSELSKGVAARQRETTAYERRIQEENQAFERRRTEATETQTKLAQAQDIRSAAEHGVTMEETARRKAARTSIAEIVRSQVMGEGGSQGDADTLAERVMAGDFPTRDEKVWATVDAATHKAAMYIRAGLTREESLAFDERLRQLATMKDSIGVAAYYMLEDQITAKYLGVELLDPKAREAGIREWAQVAMPGNKASQDQLVRLAMQSILVGPTGMAILNREAEGEQPTAGMKNAQFLAVLLPQRQALQARVDNGTATEEEKRALQGLDVMVAVVTPEGSKILRGEEPGLTASVRRQTTANTEALKQLLSQMSETTKYYSPITDSISIPNNLRPEQIQTVYDALVGRLRSEKGQWTSGEYNASAIIQFLSRLSGKDYDSILNDIGYTAEEAFGQRPEATVRGISAPISGDLSPLERVAMREAPALEQQITSATDVASLEAAMDSFRSRIGLNTADENQKRLFRSNVEIRKLADLYEQRLSELSRPGNGERQARPGAPQGAPSPTPASRPGQTRQGATPASPPVRPTPPGTEYDPWNVPTSNLQQNSQDIVDRILKSNRPKHLKKRLLKDVLPGMDDSSLERLTMNYGSSLVGRRTLPRGWTA